ncbi:MAG: hypothetical protein IRZ16_15200 [Myxococcaceae bacterium]|nr:hypothetical protein [Myxococcaceae bacterium]
MRGICVVIAVGGLLLASCAEDFTPATDVAGLRVLGIRSEPAEVAPGQLAEVSALVVDPTAPARHNTLVWISCDPDPFDLNRSACSDLEQLADASSLFAPGDGGTPDLPPGMKLAGFGDKAYYAPPADLFDALDGGDPRRQSGTVAQLLLLAIAEEVSPTATQEELKALFERVRTHEVASVLALFRVRVSESTEPNHNPQIGAVLVDGEPVPAGAHVTVTPGRDARIRFTAPEESLESWDQPLPTGVERRTERLVASPYTTGGLFNFERVAVNEDFDTVYTPPSGTGDDPLPVRGRFWVVVRDTRGGQSWREHRLHFCEPLGEVPAIRRVMPSEVESEGGVTVTLEGDRADRVLDVLIGGAALDRGGYSEATKQFSGGMPALSPGTYPVLVRTVDCVTLDTGLKVTVR